MPKVSVIIPVYNVEEYIEHCLHSLFGQTMSDIEYIFVDDCSPDNSVKKILEILELYPYRKPQTLIISHTENKGTAVARRTGIHKASGEYIISCDPDDYIEINMYELMYAKAVTTGSDIVVCDFYIETSTSSSIKNFVFNGSTKEYLMMGIKTNFGYASTCNKLVRRSIIEKYDIVPYPDCDYGEDLGCVMRILYYAESISTLGIPLYHYRIRENSITNIPMDLDVYKTRLKLVDNICTFFEGKGFDTLCNALKFNIKLAGRHLFENDEKAWVELYRECHRDILKFSDNPLRIRLLWRIALSDVRIYKLIKRFVKGLR